MILSDLSIKRPIFAAVLMLALVTLGLFSYRRLSVEMFPNVEFPVVSVVTTFSGASPETVERELSKRIEEAVNQIAGVKHVFSTSREGVSTRSRSSRSSISTPCRWRLWRCSRVPSPPAT